MYNVYIKYINKESYTIKIKLAFLPCLGFFHQRPKPRCSRLPAVARPPRRASDPRNVPKGDLDVAARHRSRTCMAAVFWAKKRWKFLWIFWRKTTRILQLLNIPGFLDWLFFFGGQDFLFCPTFFCGVLGKPSQKKNGEKKWDNVGNIDVRMSQVLGMKKWWKIKVKCQKWRWGAKIMIIYRPCSSHVQLSEMSGTRDKTSFLC